MSGQAPLACRFREVNERRNRIRPTATSFRRGQNDRADGYRGKGIIHHMNARPNIVLVHGAWADGSCWSSVVERLQAALLLVNSRGVGPGRAAA
jgi:hypothetical protein